jgi:hypothetical protein
VLFGYAKATLAGTCGLKKRGIDCEVKPQPGSPAAASHPYTFAFWLARLAAAQPSLVIWRARPTAKAPAGTLLVMQEPAPM